MNTFGYFSVASLTEAWWKLVANAEVQWLATRGFLDPWVKSSPSVEPSEESEGVADLTGLTISDCREISADVKSLILIDALLADAAHAVLDEVHNCSL